MNLTIGLFGILGFSAHELSFLLSVKKNGTPIDKGVVFSRHYFFLVCLFALIVFFITNIFAIPDMAVNIFPAEFQNISVLEAGRAVIVGLAAVHIYKTSKKFPFGKTRVETTSVELQPITLRSVHRWWKNY